MTPGRTEEAAGSVCEGSPAHPEPGEWELGPPGGRKPAVGGPGKPRCAGSSLGLGCGGEETGKLLVTWNLRIRERWCVLLVFCSCESKIGLTYIFMPRIAP